MTTEGRSALFFEGDRDILGGDFITLLTVGRLILGGYLVIKVCYGITYYRAEIGPDLDSVSCFIDESCLIPSLLDYSHGLRSEI